MSGMITIGGSSAQLVIGMNNFYNDEILQPVDYRFSNKYTRNGRRRDVDVLWPRSSFTGIDYPNFCPVWEYRHQDWEPPHVYWTGGNSLRQIGGVAYDANGVPLGGATVMLFNTTTGQLVQTVTADSAGNYVVGDPNNVNSFIVAYKAGSPDVAGASVNTL